MKLKIRKLIYRKNHSSEKTSTVSIDINRMTTPQDIIQHEAKVVNESSAIN